MEAYTISGLTFYYPHREKAALESINLKIQQGEFITICGKSGSGKSTLLRHLKTVLAPFGKREGEIFYRDQLLKRLDQRHQASEIGFVLQNPDSQIVTDKVWHELAFGLESLGYDSKTIRLRVAEMASFFGITDWFHRETATLSGGQKQLLNLAAVMVMQPKVLLLDEPTCQLDPIAAVAFLEALHRINREFGTTVILTEHRLDEALPLSDRVIVMEQGRILLADTPRQAGLKLRETCHDMFLAMPVPMQIYCKALGGWDWDGTCPLTVREGREWLDRLMKESVDSVGEMVTERLAQPASSEKAAEASPMLKLDHVWLRYDKSGPDILKDLSLTIKKGEFYAIVGGNGTGKTTALSAIIGNEKIYRGKIKMLGGRMAALPQNPQTLFVRNTVLLDLLELSDLEAVQSMAELTEIRHLFESHPYDLSGGEQQQTALTKVLLTGADLLLLDEPTKGMDNHFKRKLAKILNAYKEKGGTILMVSHDVEFCAAYTDRCGLFFDGDIVIEDETKAFFSGNRFYTTAANRMCRHHFPEAVTIEDVLSALR